MTNFDDMAQKFTGRVSLAANWKHSYFGAAYATRIRRAIYELKLAIAEAEEHPEIGTVQVTPHVREGKSSDELHAAGRTRAGNDIGGI